MIAPMQPQNIILTGFMGTGKTTVGRLLASRLGLDFIDTDEEIVARDGRSIAEIFGEDGEAAFRQWEAQIAAELAERQGLVIATGGRLMLDPDNAAALGRTGPVLCLTARPETILARLEEEPRRRPLFDTVNKEDRLEALLQEREPHYARFRRVDTEGRPPQEVVAELAAWLENGRCDCLPVTTPDGRYTITVGYGLLEETVALSGLTDPVMVVTDSNVGPLYVDRIARAEAVMAFPAGESQKTLETVGELYTWLFANGMDRWGTVVALGGGVVGDTAGFAAATFMRGVAFAPCPTTLLSMVDASIGGKTGVDLPEGKNLVGAFKQPAAVIADLGTLATLPAIEFTAGMAEVAKHGLIADPLLWQRLQLEDWTRQPAEYTADPLLAQSLQTLVTQAIRVKRDIVEEDPYEQGRRAVLNLGHTFGHAIEQVSGYAIGHGFAVAMGLVAAADLSARLGHCPDSLIMEVENVVAGLGLPTHIPHMLEPDDILQAMYADKKKQDGRLRFILLHDVGNVFVSGEVDEAAVMETLAARRAPALHGETAL